MVDYQQIYEAFIVYAASRDQGAWSDLWILCQRREEALVKSRLKGKPPLDDVDGIITDATGRALERMQKADTMTPETVSKICWRAYMDTVSEYFAALKRWRRMGSMAAMLNSVKHY